MNLEWDDLIIFHTLAEGTIKSDFVAKPQSKATLGVQSKTEVAIFKYRL